MSVSVEEVVLCSVYIEVWAGLMGHGRQTVLLWKLNSSWEKMFAFWFMECFGQEGVAVCVIWEAAGLCRYGNQNLPDWLLVVLMFKRHLGDRHMHTHMIKFRSEWPNLRVSLAMKSEMGIKESYYTYTQSKHSNSYMHRPIKIHLFPQDINYVSEEQWGFPFPDKREETSGLATKTCTKTSHLYI